MALYNEMLVGRFNRLLQKFLSMKGGPPAPQLASEIAPSIAMFMGREARWLEGWQSYGAFMLAAGVAANNSAARIRNPATSGVIAVIEKISIICPAAATALLTFSGPPAADLGDLAIVGSQIGLDGRQKQGQTSNFSGLHVTGKNNNATTFGTNFGRADFATAQNYEYIGTDIQELVLTPGSSIDVTNQTANSLIAVSYIWRERQIEESEAA